MSKDVFDLIIIDDSVRFAFHVWRYLGRSIGIGSGLKTGNNPLPPGDEQLKSLFKAESGLMRPLPTSDGRVEVWYIPGDKNLGANLEILFSLLSKVRKRFFVVDMVGQPTLPTLEEESSGSESLLGGDGERLGLEAVNWIVNKFYYSNNEEARRYITVVSSYETGSLQVKGLSKPLRIWPKSPDTLERLWRDVSPEKRMVASAVGEPCLHILVTGAGFEIRNDQSGCFGLPTTAEFLLEMGDPFGNQDRLLRARPSPGLPAFEPKLKGWHHDFETIADKGNLDDWWNFLLEREIEEAVPKLALSDIRIPLKNDASMRERDMREAFRRVILRYDWGYLNQCLDAVKINWASWLTTNYTRFADRAIDLVQADWDRRRPNGEGKNSRRWRVVSTSIEASFLSRETLHRSNRRSDPDSKAEDDKYRYLFKLHGDIAHLHTMAAAGYDKELYGPLSVPVDSLHQVYAMAEDYLRHLVVSNPPARLVWHIVGHGLQDWLLLNLIVEVCRSSKGQRVDFLMVNPHPERAEKNLRDFLSKNPLDAGVGVLVPLLEQRSAEYLSRISRHGDPPERGSDGWVENWFRELGFT